jgi:hypothetical protein
MDRLSEALEQLGWQSECFDNDNSLRIGPLVGFLRRSFRGREGEVETHSASPSAEETQELELWAVSMLGRSIGSNIDDCDLADLAELVVFTKMSDTEGLVGGLTSAANHVQQAATTPGFFSTDAPLLSREIMDFYQLKRKKVLGNPSLQEIEKELAKLETVSTMNDQVYRSTKSLPISTGRNLMTLRSNWRRSKPGLLSQLSTAHR